MTVSNPVRLPWLYGSKMLLTWGDLDDPSGETGTFDPVSQQFILAGTMRIDSIVDDTTEVGITGITFPLVMTLLPGSSGVWYARTPGSEVVTVGQLLKVRYFALASGGAQLVRYRTFTVVEG